MTNRTCPGFNYRPWRSLVVGSSYILWHAYRGLIFFVFFLTMIVFKSNGRTLTLYCIPVALGMHNFKWRIEQALNSLNSVRFSDFSVRKMFAKQTTFAPSTSHRSNTFQLTTETRPGGRFIVPSMARVPGRFFFFFKNLNREPFLWRAIQNHRWSVCKRFPQTLFRTSKTTIRILKVSSNDRFLERTAVYLWNECW